MVEPTIVADLTRRLTMALLMLVHIQFAALLIGIFGIGVMMEFFGLLSPRQPHFDRLARVLARFAILFYSTGAVIAIIFILVISLFWPTFWYSIMRINFWAMVLEGFTFVLTILYLFPWYYTWDRLSGFKAVHVSLGLALVMVAQLQQGMIDVMAGYMLTPTPPEDLLRVFFNASVIPLDMHRIVGDVSFAGFVVAGYAAYKTLRTQDPSRKAFYDWAGNIGLIAGAGFLFLQPAIGLAYVEEIRANTPGAFTVMMRGRLSWEFLIQVAFLSLLFALGVLYMWLQSRKSGRHGQGVLKWMFILVVLSGLLLVQPHVIGPSEDYPWIYWVNPIGTMQPWKYMALAGMSLGTIIAIIFYLRPQRHKMRWGYLEHSGRGAQYTLLVLAVLASAMMALMGYIRESSRTPFLIYYQERIDAPQVFPQVQPTPTPANPSSFILPSDPGTVEDQDSGRVEQ